MTVVILTKNKDTYMIYADGRTTEGSIIMSDNSVKVAKGKDYIVGFCGNCSDEMLIMDALSKETDPLKLLRLLNSEEYLPLFDCFGVLVATKHHGCYMVDKEEDDKKEDRIYSVNIMRIIDDELPQLAGSGKTTVKAILSANPTIDIKKAMVEGYKVNHTIGGKISSVSLRGNKEL